MRSIRKGDGGFEFQRTVSRLEEMRAEDYPDERRDGFRLHTANHYRS